MYNRTVLVLYKLLNAYYDSYELEDIKLLLTLLNVNFRYQFWKKRVEEIMLSKYIQ